MFFRLAGFVGLTVVLAGCLSPRANEAAAVLADLAAGEGPSQLKQATPTPVRTTIRYRRSAGESIADLYQGTTDLRGGIVLVPGLTPYGKDDPRLAAFAGTLARARFLVLVPDIANTRALKVSAADTAYIADAIEELAARSAAGAAGPVGVVAVSFAVGPVLLAATETAAGRHIRFIVAIGGYYDIGAAIGYATTGYYRQPDGSWLHGAPNELGKLVFLRSNADRIGDPADRARLIMIADRRMANPAADIGDLIGPLGPEGRAVFELIDNRHPHRVGELIARLPAAIRQELRQLDLKNRNLAALAGPVLLVHGTDDPVIPASESVRLAAALGGRAELYLIDRLAHVDAAMAGLGDSVRLWNATIRILELRDQGRGLNP